MEDLVWLLMVYNELRRELATAEASGDVRRVAVLRSLVQRTRTRLRLHANRDYAHRVPIA